MGKYTEIENTKILAMRERGKTFAQIAHAIGKTPAGLTQHFYKKLRDRPASSKAPSASAPAENLANRATAACPVKLEVSDFAFPETSGTPSERLARTLEALIQGVATGRLQQASAGTVFELTERYLRVLELNLEAHRVAAGKAAP